MSIEIIVAVGLVLLVAVLIRSAMTLADISRSLERLADARQEVKVSVQPPVPDQSTVHGEGKDRQEREDTEIAAIIAVARAAMDGSVKIAS